MLLVNDGFPVNDIHIRLDAVFTAITDSIYEVYVFMNRVIIHVAGYEFTLWNFVIGAMIIAFVTAACIPDSPYGSYGGDFTVPDEAEEFYDAGYFDG